MVIIPAPADVATSRTGCSAPVGLVVLRRSGASTGAVPSAPVTGSTAAWYPPVNATLDLATASVSVSSANHSPSTVTHPPPAGPVVTHRSPSSTHRADRSHVSTIVIASPVFATTQNRAVITPSARAHPTIDLTGGNTIGSGETIAVTPFGDVTEPTFPRIEPAGAFLTVTPSVAAPATEQRGAFVRAISPFRPVAAPGGPLIPGPGG